MTSLNRFYYLELLNDLEGSLFSGLLASHHSRSVKCQYSHILLDLSSTNSVTIWCNSLYSCLRNTQRNYFHKDLNKQISKIVFSLPLHNPDLYCSHSDNCVDLNLFYAELQRKAEDSWHRNAKFWGGSTCPVAYDMAGYKAAYWVRLSLGHEYFAPDFCDA